MAFDIALICENGHKITGRLSARPEFFVKYCKYCSAPTISKCECGAEIQGCLISDLHFPDNVPVPNYCHECGRAYPWTAQAIEELRLIIEKDKKLKSKDKAQLKECVPYLLSEQPKTQRAGLLIKQAAAIVAHDTFQSITDFIVKYACEYIKNLF